MFLTIIEDAEKNTIFYESIFPAVVAAAVAILGIAVQFFVGVRGNNLVIKSISETKKIESCMKFYRPLNMLLYEVILFLESHRGFEYDESQYQNINYCKELKELQGIYSKVCKWYNDNYVNMYPENEELDKLILEIYSHMRIVLHVTETSPESWIVLSKYKRDSIASIINNINLQINQIAYK